MARQPSGRGSAGKSEAARPGRAEPAERPAVEDEPELDPDDEIEDLDDEDVDEEDVDEEPDADVDDAVDGRSAETDALWADVRIDPVEIALPRGVGYTLRAYRPSTELTPPDITDREDEFATAPVTARDDEDEIPEIDEEELTQLALAAGGERQPRTRRGRVDERVDDDEDADDDGPDRDVVDESDEDDEDDDAAAETDEADDDAEDDEDEADEEEPEEVPAFLSERGRLLLFRTAEGLVEYVRSDAQHDLVQLDTWAHLRNRVQVDDIVPNEADTYELDLVVENLRGGPDAWDAGLLIQAGEVARDIAYALRLEPVVTALSPGSPLDDLDDALRAAEDGGIGAFFARRKVRKIRSETAALGWRTIIGKISALVDWRD